MSHWCCRSAYRTTRTNTSIAWAALLVRVPLVGASSSWTPSEQYFLSLPQIRRLPLERAPSIPADRLQFLSDAVAATFAKIPADVKADAYRAWLSYYASQTHHLRWSRTRLVEEGLDYVVGGLGWHLDYAPPIAKSVATMLRLGEVRGVDVVRDEDLVTKEQVKEKRAKWDKHSRKRAKAG